MLKPKNKTNYHESTKERKLEISLLDGYRFALPILHSISYLLPFTPSLFLRLSPSVNLSIALLYLTYDRVRRI